MVRIYWNISSAQDGLVWSIDDGDQKNEVNVKSILVKCDMETKEDLKAEWPYPKGWLENKEGCFVLVGLNKEEAVILEQKYIIEGPAGHDNKWFRDRFINNWKWKDIKEKENG